MPSHFFRSPVLKSNAAVFGVSSSLLLDCAEERERLGIGGSFADSEVFPSLGLLLSSTSLSLPLLGDKLLGAVDSLDEASSALPGVLIKIMLSLDLRNSRTVV